LLLVRSHQEEIIIVKRLIQERGRELNLVRHCASKAGNEPRSRDRDHYTVAVKTAL